VASEGPGAYRILAQLRRDEAILAETEETVLTLSAPEIPGGFAHRGGSDAVEDAVARLVHSSLEGAHGERIVAPRPGSLNREDWQALLDVAEVGGVGVIGPLRPENELAHTMLAERGVTVDLHFGIGNWMGCYHWMPAADLFEGLPAGGLAGEWYADVLPHYVMSELGGQVLAGSFRNTQTRREAPAMIWYSDVEAIPFGKGTLIFCQYRLFDRVGGNPLADRLLSNLLRLSGAFVPSA
jgi:hypothetical protein